LNINRIKPEWHPTDICQEMLQWVEASTRVFCRKSWGLSFEQAEAVKRGGHCTERFRVTTNPADHCNQLSDILALEVRQNKWISIAATAEEGEEAIQKFCLRVAD